METNEALAAFAALSQETRLQALRRLVKAGPEGVTAGELATATGTPASTLSFHLKELQRAGLVTAARSGRNIRYRADYGALTGLIRFLMDDCCQGEPAICNEIVEAAAC
jgi:DNA-binding transcriptional ArsR family regulator